MVSRHKGQKDKHKVPWQRRQDVYKRQVRTDRPVPKDRIFDCMKELDKKTLLLPIALGDIIIKGIGGTDANLVCAGTISKK